jgi:short-subunit dehydrogenase
MTSHLHHRALITGATSGIGKATAMEFARLGTDLVLVSRSPDTLAQVAKAANELAIAETGNPIHITTYAIDLADVGQVRSQFETIAKEANPITILVNNAGMGYTGTLMDTSLEDWQTVLTLNLTSVFQCILGILPSMRDRQQGTIINVASIAAHLSFPGWGAYNVSKAGLVSLSKTLSAEEKENGIRVMLITPGAVNTPIWDTDTVHADFNRTKMLTPEMVAQSIVHAALLPTNALIEELVITPSAGAL